VRRLGFSLTASVDDLEPRYRARVVIRVDDVLAKTRFTDLAIDKHLNNAPLAFLFRCRDKLKCFTVDVGGIEFQTNGVVGR